MASTSFMSSSLLSTMQSMSLGGTPEFVKPFTGKYLCVYCNNGLRPPVKQTECGHRLCDICLNKALREEENRSCPGQEEGCLPLNESSIYPDRGTDREISNMEVYCPNKPRCNVTPKWRLLNKHITEECEFNVVSCPNAMYGCSVTFLQKEKEKHLAECGFKLTQCTYCRKEFRAIAIAQHEQKCKDEQIECSFAEEGCSFRGNRKDVYDHTRHKEAIANHLEKTVQKLREEQKQNAQLNSKLQEMDVRTKELHRYVNEVQEDLNRVKLQTRSENAKIQQVLFGNGKSDEDLFTLAGTIRNRSGLLQQMEDRLNMLEENSNPFDSREAKLSGVTEDITRIIKNNEQMVAQHDVTLAEHEIRFRCLETTNYNGVLVWKITNYRSRKLAAIEEKTLSIYSQPFFTDPYGYKMCARIYLNGDGMGKCTHASLYFAIMKGEYDSLLSWPFRQRVTMILLDQENGRKHIRDTFRPDPTSTSFGCPVNPMNVASGSPLFVAQSVLESSTYLKDDTIYIMIKVDLSDLNQFGLN